MRSKKTTSKGALTIPKDLRAVTGITEGTAIDIEKVEGGILIRQHVPACRFCGSIESVGTIKGDPVCAKCAAEIHEEVHTKYAVG